MRVWRFMVLAGFVCIGIAPACTGTPNLPVVDAPPRALPMKVIVGTSGVAMYLGAADLGDCPCNASVFPAEGMCFRPSDANPCSSFPACTSCITDFGVEQAGVRLTPRYFGADPRVLGFDVAITDAPLTIVLEGCGHPASRIPISGGAFPSATVTADYTTGGAHASWSTDASPLEALVTMFPGPNDFVGETCFVTGATEYTSTMVPDASSVDVEPLGSRDELETEFGHATIWRAGDASAQFPRQ